VNEKKNAPETARSFCGGEGVDFKTAVKQLGEQCGLQAGTWPTLGPAASSRYPAPPLRLAPNALSQKLAEQFIASCQQNLAGSGGERARA
jgi:hypothetical protein